MRKEKETLSLISEQIQKLRDLADDLEIDMYGIRELNDICKEAADTIETLSAKLASANMERSSAHYNGGWIPVSEKLPEITIEDKYSKDVLTALKWYDGDITYSVGWYNKSGVWNEDYENCKVVAWMPLPNEYEEK